MILSTYYIKGLMFFHLKSHEGLENVTNQRTPQEHLTIERHKNVGKLFELILLLP
jgi:hypothetical protein